MRNIVYRSADAGSARHLPWRPLPSEPGVIKFEFSLCTRDGRPGTAVVDLSDPRHRGLFRGATAPRDRWHRYRYSLYSIIMYTEGSKPKPEPDDDMEITGEGSQRSLRRKKNHC